jgi:hypothetical protein
VPVPDGKSATNMGVEEFDDKVTSFRLMINTFLLLIYPRQFPSAEMVGA